MKVLAKNGKMNNILVKLFWNLSAQNKYYLFTAKNIPLCNFLTLKIEKVTNGYHESNLGRLKQLNTSVQFLIRSSMSDLTAVHAVNTENNCITTTESIGSSYSKRKYSMSGNKKSHTSGVIKRKPWKNLEKFRYQWDLVWPSFTSGYQSHSKESGKSMEHQNHSGFDSLHRTFNYYRPQRSWGKVIFSQASVILLTGGSTWPGRHPLGRHPPGRHPRQVNPPRQIPPSRYTPGWYPLAGTPPGRYTTP